MSFLRENLTAVDKKRIVSVLSGVLLVFLVPYLHLGVINNYVFNDRKTEVDKKTCWNECWDTKFKGDYEKIPAHYKHIYFNITINTLQIWFVTVAYLIAFYETSKRITRLFLERKLRYSMLVLFGVVVYSHYYAWWSVFNYLNDDFYDQWFHQMYFSCTEMISTICVVYLFNQDNYMHSRILLAIIDIALFHILLSTRDQFLSNVFGLEGEMYQITRDIAFMVPDIMHVVIPGFWLWRLKRNELDSLGAIPKSATTSHEITKHDILYSIGAILIMAVFGSML